MNPALSRVHEYAVRPDGPGWVLTRDGRPVCGFDSYDQALSTAEKIAADLGRAGVIVQLLPCERTAGRA